MDLDKCNQTDDFVQHNDDDNGPGQPPGIPQVDGNYTITDVFSAADIDYYTQTQLNLEEFAHKSDVLCTFPGRAFELVQSLDLVIPTMRSSDYLSTFPGTVLARSRVMSISEGQLSQISTTDHRPSVWRRQLRRLRRFLDSLPFRK